MSGNVIQFPAQHNKRQEAECQHLHWEVPHDPSIPVNCKGCGQEITDRATILGLLRVVNYQTERLDRRRRPWWLRWLR